MSLTHQQPVHQHHYQLTHLDGLLLQQLLPLLQPRVVCITQHSLRPPHVLSSSDARLVEG